MRLLSKVTPPHQGSLQPRPAKQGRFSGRNVKSAAARATLTRKKHPFRKSFRRVAAGSMTVGSRGLLHLFPALLSPPTPTLPRACARLFSSRYSLGISRILLRSSAANTVERSNRRPSLRRVATKGRPISHAVCLFGEASTNRHETLRTPATGLPMRRHQRKADLRYQQFSTSRRPAGLRRYAWCRRESQGTHPDPTRVRSIISMTA